MLMPIDPAFSEKTQRFLADLQRLCQQHRVSLATSGYDALQVWDAESDTDIYHAQGIQDRTRHEGQA